MSPHPLHVPAPDSAVPGEPAARQVRLRRMTDADCEAVAAVRVGGWRHAYAGLMPQEYLDAMDETADAGRRRAQLAAADRAGVVHLVAEAAGEVVGWGCYGPYREEDTTTGDGEVYALYVRPERIGTGVGRALLTGLLSRAEADGRPALLLWVLKDNARARRFYEKAGFTADGAQEPFEVGGAVVQEVRYGRRLSAAEAAADSRG
ncbi:GNAT family N-acetyltransferase [Streptomyces sp. NPDC059881]|uniref:GNAT family N-acetyltransferase n=1 Tax=Streptomyces sp. NPDC059881 TaxID=3346986 RepID=UPI0036495097